MSTRSETIMKWREKSYKEFPWPTKGRKRCTKCGVVKNFDTEDKEISEFHIRKNQAYKMEAAGYDGVYYKPDSWCKICKNGLNEARRQRRIAENPERERKLKKENDKRYRENIGNERWLELKRQRSTRYRRKRGIGLNKPLPSGRHEDMIMVDAEPFINWVNQKWPIGGYHRSIMLAIPQSDRKLSKVMTGQQKTVNVDWVDAVITHFNGPHLSVLYPELYKK